MLNQSLAIIEYLDETHPEPPLLPKDALGRARVRAIALDMACEIHPLDNLRVLRYLVKEMGVSEDDKNRWYRHWVETGLEVVERRLAGDASTGRFCHGDRPGLADCVLVPQIFNAQRMECRLDHVPTVMRVFEQLHGRTRLRFDAALGLPGRDVSRPASWLVPTWTSAAVGALMSAREGGVSDGPFASMNLGAAVGDAADRVAAEPAAPLRHGLRSEAGLSAPGARTTGRARRRRRREPAGCGLASRP